MAVESFKSIVADPPWYERGGGKIKRGADRHYSLIKSRSDILKVMLNAHVWRPAKSGCHMYLWVTNNFLLDGLWLLDALGFRYITNVCWVKPRFGLGRYFRGQHELCLFGSMGASMLPLVRNVPTIIAADTRGHSRKPIKFYKLVETVSPGPRLEMFARHPREGWVVWGNEL